MKQYKYVSFDIFDTLVKRNVFNPSDVFDLMILRYNKNHDVKINFSFKNDRIMAEKCCRKEKLKEITINDIYNKLLDSYDNLVLEEMKNIEVETEFDVATKNLDPFILEMYEKGKNECKIIITSDMYLPYDVISKILKKCDINDYYKLYLSSEIGEKKSTGKLFEFILKDLNIKSDELIHIGDNKNSDYIQPKKLDISALKYNKKNMIKKINNIKADSFNSFISNNLNSNEYFYCFGYKYFGPILFYFSKWLDNEITKDNINKIFFLSRDGKIMLDAYKKYKHKFDEKNISYMYASRRALIVPSFCNYKSMNDILKSFNLPKLIVLEDLLNRLGLDSYNLDKIVSDYNLDIKKEYVLNELLEQKDFLNHLFPIIQENSKIEKTNMEKYLKNIGFENDVAIVDIGWYGNMQLALTKNVNAKIHGYYFGLRPNKKENIDTKGCFFDKDRNVQLNNREFPLNSIFEFLFTANHGSVKNYLSDGKNVELYPCEYSKYKEKKIIFDIQQGALNFICDFRKSKLDDYIELDLTYVFERLLNVLENPTLEDAKKIGSLKFVDGSPVDIANSMGLKYYFLHPKKMIYDLKHSTWKVGFLKQTFVLNFNYNKLYKLLKKNR